MYCSNNSTDDCVNHDSIVRTAFEDLFHQYKVDLSFWGHEHSYERLFPVYNYTMYGNSSSNKDVYINPEATIHVTTGAAGCPESHAVFRDEVPAWSAVRSSTWGYGQLEIYDAKHLRWMQFDDSDGQVIDDFHVIRSDEALPDTGNVKHNLRGGEARIELS